MPDVNPTRPPSPGVAAAEARSLKTAVVAGVLLAFALVSGAAMLWSGWLLLRGERLPYPWTRLPKECAWVAQADEPDQGVQAWQAVAGLAQVPPAWRQFGADEAARWRGLTNRPDLDATQAWGLCARAAGPELSVAPAAPTTASQRAAFAADLHLAPYLRWATGPLPWDPAAVALPDPATRAPPATGERLEHDALFREAMERTGGGQAHVYVGQQALGQWASRLPDPVVRNFLQLGTFAAVALRVDAEHVVWHAHIGTGQRGAVYLKQHLDPVHELDAATLIDPAAPVRGVARFHPGALEALRTRHPLLGLLDRWMAAHALANLAPFLTGQVAWQQFGTRAEDGVALTLQLAPHTAAPPWQAACATPAAGAMPAAAAGLACRAGAGYLVVASSAAAAARAAAVAGGRIPSLRAVGGLGADLERLMAQTQGLRLQPGARVEVPGLGQWVGPFQVEAIWIDSGLAAEIAVPRSPPH